MATRGWNLLFGLVGLLGAAATAWHVLTLPPSHSLLHRVIDVVVQGGAAVSILFIARWHATEGVADERYPRIVAWVIAAVLLFGVVTVSGLYAGSEQVLPGELWEVLELAGIVGAFAGVLVGTIEARAIGHAEAAATAEARAAALAAERDRTEHVTALLRHYVRNAVTAITGYTDHLEGEVPPAERAKLETIEERALTIATLVDNVSTLAAVERAEPSAATDLESALTEAIDGLAAQSETDVAPPSDVPPAPLSEGSEAALHLAFEGIGIAADEAGTLTVDCQRDEESVVVSIRTEDADLPESVARSPFGPGGSGVGLRLHLAQELLSGGGDLWIAEDDDGVVRFDLRVRPVER
ncbi:MAG: hypothetical protein ABEJ89_09690 [Haloarculaceae archaeon]